ncbi:MAG: hypothetical protein H6621_02740 [Halobacteriovoraceae bacterium]|nr:hypothetical protein [Halobacteriovoraceae bacterium]MCB9093961.1 hypothetical protein [Halobacteriovoraceae bacterium]
MKLLLMIAAINCALAQRWSSNTPHYDTQFENSVRSLSYLFQEYQPKFIIYWEDDFKSYYTRDTNRSLAHTLSVGSNGQELEWLYLKMGAHPILDLTIIHRGSQKTLHTQDELESLQFHTPSEDESMTYYFKNRNAMIEIENTSTYKIMRILKRNASQQKESSFYELNENNHSLLKVTGYNCPTGVSEPCGEQKITITATSTLVSEDLQLWDRRYTEFSRSYGSREITEGDFLSQYQKIFSAQMEDVWGDAGFYFSLRFQDAP